MEGVSWRGGVQNLEKLGASAEGAKHIIVTFSSSYKKEGVQNIKKQKKSRALRARNRGVQLIE